MSHIISNELYDLVINAKTLEDLNIIQESFLNLNEEDDTSNNDVCVVRILSSNEFVKYIKNGTCNGSITKYDTNVWHSLESLNKNYDCIHGHNSVDPVTFNYTYYTELIADNSAGQYLNNIYNHNYSLYYTLSYRYLSNYDVGGSNYRQVSSSASTPQGLIYMNDISKITKNSANPLVKTQTVTRKSGSIQDRTYNATFNFYYVSLFRPIFVYKDNKKGKNLFE